MQSVTWMAGFLFLLSCAVWDLKYRAIPSWLLAAGAAGSVLFTVLGNDSIWELSVLGGLLGGLFFLVSRWTKEAFGYGDSCIITILGIQTGLWSLLSILWISFLAAAVFAVICSIKKKWNRKTAFPFVPFLAAAYVGVWML